MAPQGVLRAGWARCKVLSERDHDLVDSAADSLRELEHANKDMANMTREGSYKPYVGCGLRLTGLRDSVSKLKWAQEVSHFFS